MHSISAKSENTQAFLLLIRYIQAILASLLDKSISRMKKQRRESAEPRNPKSQSKLILELGCCMSILPPVRCVLTVGGPTYIHLCERDFSAH